MLVCIRHILFVQRTTVIQHFGSQSHKGSNHTSRMKAGACCDSQQIAPHPLHLGGSQKHWHQCCQTSNPQPSFAKKCLKFNYQKKYSGFGTNITQEEHPNRPSKDISNSASQQNCYHVFLIDSLLTLL